MRASERRQATALPKLTPRQRATIAALVEGKTKAQAAADADVSPATLRRWLKIPAFALALEGAQADALGAVVNKLRALSTYAADTLGLALQDAVRAGQRDPEVMAKVACAILDRCGKWIESHEVLRRLAVIEEGQRRRGPR